MNQPWYELDVLAVGDGERSGDAIALRYSIDGRAWRVMVIDGGTQDTGEALVDLITTQYGTDLVNDVVNTHPDSDHSSGLSVVLDKLNVEKLWMHRPWNYVPDILAASDDGRLTHRSVTRRIEEALRCASKVHDLAVAKGIPVVEPFAGMNVGGFTVLSPTRDQYVRLLPHFRSTPETSLPLPLLSSGIAAIGFEKARRVGGALAEALASFVMTSEARENAALGRKPTAAENESSVVLLGQFGLEKVLFTGDAGPTALTTSVMNAAGMGVSLKGLRLLQLPHHGSRNNLTPALLNQITASRAFVSVAAKSTTHPRRSVTNALQRRGTSVFATRGTNLYFQLNRLQRAGYEPVPTVPWFEAIEAE